MDSETYGRFMELLQEEKLADPSWILSLDEFDEPPLFSRNAQVEFLRSLSEEERVLAVLEIALEVIEMIASEAAQSAPDQKFFVCATFSDFDSRRSGAQLVPTPAIYVNPKVDDTVSSGIAIVEPWSEKADLVAIKLTTLGRNYAERYCVGELCADVFDPEIGRVYVGWRRDPAANISSVGGEIFKADS